MDVRGRGLGGGHVPLRCAPFPSNSCFYSSLHSYLNDVEERGRSLRRSTDKVESEESATELHEHTQKTIRERGRNPMGRDRCNRLLMYIGRWMEEVSEARRALDVCDEHGQGKSLDSLSPGSLPCTQVGEAARVPPTFAHRHYQACQTSIGELESRASLTF